jgi:hypothetical protein
VLPEVENFPTRDCIPNLTLATCRRGPKVGREALMIAAAVSTTVHVEGAASVPRSPGGLDVKWEGFRERKKKFTHKRNQ